MSWEQRKGRRYYYEAERVGGRVVKTYVGAGRVAELIAQLNVLVRDKRKWEKIGRDLAAARRSRPSRAAKVIDAADAVLAVWLPLCGWHRQNRGPWRRKRGFVMCGEVATLADRRPIDSWNTTELLAAVGDLPADVMPKDGKPTASAVAAYLTDHPAAVALYGDLARRVVQQIADGVGGEGELAAAAVVARADAIRRALAGPNPNPVELLLAERAAVSWATCYQYEMHYAAAWDEVRSLKEHDWHERRIASAHRRLLASLKTLAAVRRLKLPDLLAVVQVAGETPALTPRPAVAAETGDTAAAHMYSQSGTCSVEILRGG